MAIADVEPICVNIIGGVNFNALENTASINFGDVFLQAFDSQVKNNFMNGNTFGDFQVNNLLVTSSIVFDPDGIDTTMPMIMSPLGLED